MQHPLHQHHKIIFRNYSIRFSNTMLLVMTYLVAIEWGDTRIVWIFLVEKNRNLACFRLITRARIAVQAAAHLPVRGKIIVAAKSGKRILRISVRSDLRLNLKECMAYQNINSQTWVL